MPAGHISRSSICRLAFSRQPTATPVLECGWVTTSSTLAPSTPQIDDSAFPPRPSAPVLNPLMKLGKPTTVALRGASKTCSLRLGRRDRPDLHVVPRSRLVRHHTHRWKWATMRTSIPARTTPETWARCSAAGRALPPTGARAVGYHGRASSIVVSSTPVRRLWAKPVPTLKPARFRSSRLLDFELDLRPLTANRSASVTTAEAEIHFGLCSSTIGPPVTSKSGNTSPSAHSSAKTSDPPFPRGS